MLRKPRKSRVDHLSQVRQLREIKGKVTQIWIASLLVSPFHALGTPEGVVFGDSGQRG